MLSLLTALAITKAAPSPLWPAGEEEEESQTCSGVTEMPGACQPQSVPQYHLAECGSNQQQVPEVLQPPHPPPPPPGINQPVGAFPDGSHFLFHLI